MMGCDIHAFVEHRAPGGAWWDNFGAEFRLPRDYTMFGALAGVRDRDVEQVVPVRGLPSDPCIFTTKREWETSPTDWHSASWLTPAEWGKAISNATDDHGAPAIEYRALWTAMNHIQSAGYEVRVVFWFDN